MFETHGESLSDHTKIAVIDDHRIFLEGITLLVKGMSDIFEVEGFSAPLEFLRTVETNAKFDLVICDLIMNAMNGLAFVAALRSQSETIPILMLSGINTAPPIDEVKRLGANGFVHKSAENEILKEAIQTVLNGQAYFSDGLGDSIMRPESNSNADWETAYNGKAMPKLAARQIEVLRLIAEGATNKDVSKALMISENTVKTHLKQIFLELGVNKRTACVRKAQTLGLI